MPASLVAQLFRDHIHYTGLLIQSPPSTDAVQILSDNIWEVSGDYLDVDYLGIQLMKFSTEY